VAALAKYDAMWRAITEAHAIDEVKAVRDKAIALELYMRQIGNTDAEDRCYQIRMQAQRKAGELSKQIEKAPSGRAASFAPPGTESKTKVLNGAGISTQQASEWERLSEVARNGRPRSRGFVTEKRRQRKLARSVLLRSTSPPTNFVPENSVSGATV
jgi:hypothetical protein